MKLILTSAFICLAVALGLRADLHRRRLSFVRCAGWGVLPVLDVTSVATTIAFAASLSIQTARPFGIVASVLSLLFLWAEGRRQIQLQRPAGIVAGEWLVLFGAYLAFGEADGLGAAGWILPMITGALLLAFVVPPFLKGKEEHRILDQIRSQGESVQHEWAPPTAECPFPERWRMLDAQSAEIEVLDFLKALVLTVKPDLILETGTFIGHSAIKMAEGLKTNGFGRLITVEFDPEVFAKAKENIEASGVADWIDARNASSLETTVNGPIDILYSDSDLHIRESEVRRFLPQVREGGLVLIHDANSSFKAVREAALRLEQEGLLSVLLLPTPRGLVVAQRPTASIHADSRKGTRSK